MAKTSTRPPSRSGNVPFTREQIKKLPVCVQEFRTNGKGHPELKTIFSGFSPTSNGNSNAKRDVLTRPNNRKTTPGRRISYPVVKTKIETKFGSVKKETNRTRKVFAINPIIKTQAFLSFDK